MKGDNYRILTQKSEFPNRVTETYCRGCYEFVEFCGLPDVMRDEAVSRTDRSQTVPCH